MGMRGITQLPNQKLKKITTSSLKLGNGAEFFMEHVKITDKRFTNLYWVTLAKNKHKFELTNFDRTNSLLNISRDFISHGRGVKFTASINTSQFYLADQGKQPSQCAYNLFVKAGIMFQPPANTRPIIIESDGDLKLRDLAPVGKIKIGENIFGWEGFLGNSHGKNNQACLEAIGIFAIDFNYAYQKEGGRKKMPVPESSIVKAGPDQLLIGVARDSMGPYVNKVSNNTLNLYESDYVLRGSKMLLSQVKVKDKVQTISVDGLKLAKKVNASSGILSLSKDKHTLKMQVKKYLIPSKVKHINPTSRNFRKSWSLILETDNRVAFFINDARPKIKGQEGLNLFELHDIVSSRFNFKNAILCDAGQSSKICVKNNESELKVVGNKHYLYNNTIIPKWDGLHGRKIPSALIAYRAR